jgi:hypothetical protein
VDLMRDSAYALAPRSRALEALDFRDGAVFEPSSGLYVARPGHRWAWSRGTATLASVTATGGTYTAPATLPAYELANSQLGLRMGNDDILRGNSPVAWVPQELCGELLFVDRGARTTTNATLFAIAGDDPTSGVRIHLDTSGSYYRFTYHNGSTSVIATLTSGQPTAGQLVRMRWGWASNGVVSLRQSINGGAETTATSGALALPSATAFESARVRIGRRGLTQNPAPLTLLSLLVMPGTLTDAQWDEAY